MFSVPLPVQSYLVAVSVCLYGPGGGNTAGDSVFQQINSFGHCGM